MGVPIGVIVLYGLGVTHCLVVCAGRWAVGQQLAPTAARVTPQTGRATPCYSSVLCLTSLVCAYSVLAFLTAGSATAVGMMVVQKDSAGAASGV